MSLHSREASFAALSEHKTTPLSQAQQKRIKSMTVIYFHYPYGDFGPCVIPKEKRYELSKMTVQSAETLAELLHDSGVLEHKKAQLTKPETKNYDVFSQIDQITGNGKRVGKYNLTILPGDGNDPCVDLSWHGDSVKEPVWKLVEFLEMTVPTEAKSPESEYLKDRVNSSIADWERGLPALYKGELPLKKEISVSVLLQKTKSNEAAKLSVLKLDSSSGDSSADKAALDAIQNSYPGANLRKTDQFTGKYKVIFQSPCTVTESAYGMKVIGGDMLSIRIVPAE